MHRVALTWSGTYNLNISTFTNDIYGVVNPGSRVPKYWNEFFGIYKYAYLEGVAYKFEFLSTSPSRPVRVVIAESNTTDVTPTTFLELSETPRAKTKVMIPGGNHDVVYLNKTTTGHAIMGHKLEDDEAFWNTFSGPPAAPIQPVVCVGFEPLVPSTCTIFYQVTVKYSIKFFTLNHL